MRAVLEWMGRAATVCLALLGIVWGFWRLDLAQQEAGLNAMAMRVLTGGAEDDTAVVAMLNQTAGFAVGTTCHLPQLKARVILLMRRAEDGLLGSTEPQLLERFSALKVALGRFNGCFPGDGMVDLASYWLEINETGNIETALPHLRNSFRHAPGEALVMLRRAWLVTGVYDQVPADLQQLLKVDILRLVQAGFSSEIADLLVRAPRALQTDIITNLAVNAPDHWPALLDGLKRRGWSPG